MTIDPEIQAMTQIAEALSGLDSSVAERILRWAVARFGSDDILINKEDQKIEGDKTDIYDFSEFSELFDAASPSTEYEKVLVASYWFQEIGKQPNVNSQTVNDELKQLGHGIGNVTREFNRLQSEKPSLILQVQKKGSTKQARKLYKVTAAGKHQVEKMITGKE